MRPHLLVFAVAVAAGLVISAGWRLLVAPHQPPLIASAAAIHRSPRPAPARPHSPTDAGHIHLVVINGGGTSEQNYQSHLLHVREMLDIARAAGVPRDQTVIFNSDGSDPGDDVATRAVAPEKAWRLEGTPLEAASRPPVQLKSSNVEGATLYPATKAAVAIWFLTAEATLTPGDTLLIYVTDHGRKGQRGPDDARIVLWGKDESLTVRDLRALVASLDPKVRVLMLMSQCYSGAFAGLASGGACGYFSTTESRPAYGCYPEDRGRENTGHSFVFLSALSALGSLGAAHDETLVRDQTPDVPLRTSDFYLRDRVELAASASGQTLDGFIDGQVATAGEAGAATLALLDRMTTANGLPAMRTLNAVADAIQSLPELIAKLESRAPAAHDAVTTANRVVLENLMNAKPEWRARIAEGSAQAASDLEALLGAAVEQSDAAATEAARLHGAVGDLEQLVHRLRVREAVGLRARALLTRVAGQHWLRTEGSASDHETWAALEECEDLQLGRPSARHALPPVAAWPTLTDDLAATRRLLGEAASAPTEGAPRVGGMASPLLIDAVRGPPPPSLADGKSHLLFFWATWCRPCKASIPEVLAFGAETGISVLAISAEPAATVESFLASHTTPFPENVFVDRDHQTERAYAATGFPTFVLVDGSGVIRAHTVGYAPAGGLMMPGWSWTGRPSM